MIVPVRRRLADQGRRTFHHNTSTIISCPRTIDSLTLPNILQGWWFLKNVAPPQVIRVSGLNRSFGRELCFTDRLTAWYNGEKTMNLTGKVESDHAYATIQQFSFNRATDDQQ
jgi:hypothetical protein